MRKTSALLLFFSISTLFLVTSPRSTQAIGLTVSNVCSNPSVTTCFTSIRAAIDAANVNRTGDTITIEPGVYSESVTLKDNLPISGIETARTVLKNPGTDPIINATGLSNVTISKLTIWSTGTGILANNSAANISNNIFTGSNTGTAIVLQGTSSGQITNNTFFQNNIGIKSSDDITIQNNIFSTNATALLPVAPLTAFTKVNNNDFHNNQVVGFSYNTSDLAATNIPNNIHSNPDPKFVDPNRAPPDMDLHLMEGSPAIGIGTPSGTDIGAFGGSGADKIPFPVQNMTASATPPDSITVNWSSNNFYLITNSTGSLGSYNVSFTLKSSQTTTVEAVQAVTTPTTPPVTISHVITGLTSSIEAPPVPTNLQTGPRDGALVLTWTASTGATGYKVHYGIAAPSENTIQIDNPSVNNNIVSFTITGLVNNQNYKIAISAFASPIYDIAVTAVDNQGHESDPVSQEVPLGASISESLNSDPPVTDFPEPLTAFPDLPNNGCFIATAAYGAYSAPQVQVLREFRDRYLMTTREGRAFVRSYYRFSPAAAAYLNSHPSLKPAVQAALLPAVGGALFLMRTSLFAKLILVFIVFVATLLVCLIYRRNFFHSRGSR